MEKEKREGEKRNRKNKISFDVVAVVVIAKKTNREKKIIGKKSRTLPSLVMSVYVCTPNPSMCL